jgi:hypothetical protein
MGNCCRPSKISKLEDEDMYGPALDIEIDTEKKICDNATAYRILTCVAKHKMDELKTYDFTAYYSYEINGITIFFWIVIAGILNKSQNTKFYGDLIDGYNHKHSAHIGDKRFFGMNSLKDIMICVKFIPKDPELYIDISDFTLYDLLIQLQKYFIKFPKGDNANNNVKYYIERFYSDV